MQIVINIDEEIYKARQHLVANQNRMIDEVDIAIANGIPLPKGHGKLITEPTEEEIAGTIGGQNDFAECIRNAVKAVFDNASTIIEADKGESESKNG